MPIDPHIKKILLIGSGPILIGQATEFDFSGSQECQSLAEDGHIRSSRELKPGNDHD